MLCEGNAHPGKHIQTRILNIIFPNTLIWYIFSYQNTHEKSVNAVNKRAWDVEPSFSFSICQGWGVFQQRERERERGLEGEGVSFSILCSPENPIMKRQSTKSSEPATETKGPFIQKREQHWGKSATQHTMRSTAPPLPLQSDLPVSIKKKENKGTVFHYYTLIQ